MENFNWYRNQLRESKNTLAILVDAMKNWHSNIPDIDGVDTYAKMGNILKRLQYDDGYLLFLIWQTACKDISGSHLNYINAIVSKKNESKQSFKPNRFISRKKRFIVAENE